MCETGKVTALGTCEPEVPGNEVRWGAREASWRRWLEVGLEE